MKPVLRWRCMVDDCPQRGVWTVAGDPKRAAHTHYMRSHYVHPGGHP